MRRWIVLLATVAGCEAPAKKPPAPTEWATPPLPAAWTGVPGASIGRGQAPQLVVFAGLTELSYSTPQVWQVPGDGPARAVVVGGDMRSVGLVEIDSGKRLWSAGKLCSRVLGVTRDAVLCTLTGKPDAVVVDIATGKQRGTVGLPVEIELVRAVCGDGAREVFAQEKDGRLLRIVGNARSWEVPSEPITGLLACDGASVVVTTASGVVALARETGKELGRMPGGAGVWTARDTSDRIEVATEAGIVRVARDLSGPREALEGLPLGRHIASHGELRLVASSSTTAVLLDGKGVRAYLPFAYDGAALGSSTVLTGNAMLRSIVVPPRETRALRIVRGPQRYIAVPAELRDLPPTVFPSILPIDAPDDLEPDELVVAGESVYLLGKPEKLSEKIRMFRFDGRAWSADDKACGDGWPLDLAVVGERVICASFTFDDATVRSGWEWKTKRADAIAARGDSVLVFDSDRLHVLDLKTGTPRGVLASDHGGRMPAAVIDIAGTTLLVTAERNRIVARLPSAQLVPVWSVDVRGSVVAIHAAGEGVVAVLDDGDAYRIDARTGQPTGLGAIGLDWLVTADRIAVHGAGGALPVAGWPPAPAAPKDSKPKKGPAKKAAAKDDDDIPRPPRLVTTVAPPANLLPSWQLSVFDLAGALRSRNDYALAGATPALARMPGAPLVVVGDGNRTALVLDPETGNPLRRVTLPEGADPRAVFSLVVDGKPITGVMLANPLRAVLF